MKLLNKYFFNLKHVKMKKTITHKNHGNCMSLNVTRAFSILLFFLFTINASAQLFDGDKPAGTYATEYSLSFADVWDGAQFYTQWDTKEADNFTVADVVYTYQDEVIVDGYLNIKYPKRRVVLSKAPYIAPYVFQAEMECTLGYRASLVIRANPENLDEIQEPGDNPQGFNSEGITFYPNEAGTALIVQFNGDGIKFATTFTRIEVPNPTGVENLKVKGVMRIEDFGNRIYAYYNDVAFARINLTPLVGTETFYTAGTVLDANMNEMGTFTGMKVAINGKVGFGMREATMQLYNVSIKSELVPTGIDNPKAESSFSIYPNPATNWLNVESKSNQQVEVSVYNTIGQVVFQSKNIVAEGSKINTGSWSKGIYVIKFKTVEGEELVKFAVQ